MSAEVRDGGAAGSLNEILSTAEAIGFSVPDPSRSMEDVQTEGYYRNITHLVKSAKALSDLRSLSTALDKDVSVKGLLNKWRMDRCTDFIKEADKCLLELLDKKDSVVMSLKTLSAVAAVGIPLERGHQKAFGELVDKIVVDRFDLMNAVIEFRKYALDKESAVSWKGGVEGLRGFCDQIANLNDQCERLAKIIEKHTVYARHNKFGRSSKRQNKM